jgi:CheY-like chemotaxis protein
MQEPTASSTVLVVDDDPSVLSTYRRLLCRAGYRTVTRSHPQQVLDEDVPPFDLLLIDYKMPGMDGLTLLAALRRRECRAHCILISAFLNEDLRHQARNLGVHRVLDKPVDASQLRQTIQDLLPPARPEVESEPWEPSQPSGWPPAPGFHLHRSGK